MHHRPNPLEVNAGMSTDTPEALAPPPKAGRLVVAACYFLGIAAIVGWSLPEAGPAAHRVESTIRLTGGEPAAAVVLQPRPVRATRSARPRANCDGCGVVESVRTIDTPEETMAWCAIGDPAGSRYPGYLFEVGDRHDPATLAETVAGAIVGDNRARKVRVTTRYEFVVRFPDGSRRVFNEDTPRTLREGERINVIAGSSGANG
jgi:outer membrane lipoprotein SlyB